MEQEKTHVPFSLDVLTLQGDRIREVTAFVVRPADTEDGYARGQTALQTPAAWRPSSGASACRIGSIDRPGGDEFPPAQESLPA